MTQKKDYNRGARKTVTPVIPYLKFVSKLRTTPEDVEMDDEVSGESKKTEIQENAASHGETSQNDKNHFSNSASKETEAQTHVVYLRNAIKKQFEFKCQCANNQISSVASLSDEICQATDSVDNKNICCKGHVIRQSLVQSSSISPRIMMCDMHLWKLKSHFSCPLCGLFCAQGTFLHCTGLDNSKKVFHLFHIQCSASIYKDVLRCLHCGSKSTMKIIELDLNLTSSPATLILEANGLKNTPGAMGFSKFKSKKGISVKCKSGSVLNTSGLISTANQQFLETLLTKVNSANKDCIPDYPIKHLYSAVIKGQTLRVLCMLVKGAVPKTKFINHWNETALHAAARAGNVIEAHILIQAGCTIDCNNDNLETPIIIGTKHNKIKIVEYLVHRNADVNHKSEPGLTCLHIAAEAGNLEMCNVLLCCCNIKLNLQDYHGLTPLVLASGFGYFDIVKVLLRKGADPKVKDKRGNTILHWAAFSGNINICKICIDCGCHINEVNINDDTALHIAAKCSNSDAVDYLLSMNARHDLKNKDGQYPHDCCSSNCQFSEAVHFNAMMHTLEKADDEIERIVSVDISAGTEKIPIRCVNWFDKENLIERDFTYVTKCVETRTIKMDRSITSLQHCSCPGGCFSSVCKCACLSFRCWYDKDERLVSNFDFYNPPVLVECNKACSCNISACRNRVVQKGIRCRLQLFRTVKKGWGVRTLKAIPKGTFICEYVGEILSDSDADEKDDDTYLFDLDNKGGDTYCLDARHFGNVSRFINHLCDANLITIKVFVDIQDTKFPRIAFFSTRDIAQYEELGFDYGTRFWSIKSKSFTCACEFMYCKYSAATIKKTMEESISND